MYFPFKIHFLRTQVDQNLWEILENFKKKIEMNENEIRRQRFLKFRVFQTYFSATEEQYQQSFIAKCSR